MRFNLTYVVSADEAARPDRVVVNKLELDLLRERGKQIREDDLFVPNGTVSPLSRRRPFLGSVEAHLDVRVGQILFT